MRMFKSRKKRLEVDKSNSNDFTVMDFLRDIDGHKKDIQEWGQSLKSFSFFDEPELITGVHKGIRRGKSFQENDKDTPEVKQLHEMRKKLLKKRNLERKKQMQSKVEITRSLSTISSTRNQREGRRIGASSLNRTRSDSFIGVQRMNSNVSQKTILERRNATRTESRDSNSLGDQRICDERDCDSDVLEDPCYCGSLDDTFESFDATDDFRKPQKHRVIVQQGLKKQRTKNKKSKNKGLNP
ncbi:predicted protein [Chaetoceros tenuissimus]|uniref:Uncharacterized protein n=1 Tax=Chaetoceros tenuissimus TaxID=426638 RepID=A0AAD3CIK3_9STRA|nr:predicted protein [Chaetoceros tenuissimus]